MIYDRERTLARSALLCAAALLAAERAFAHTGEGLAGGFLSGFGHPFGGPDHLLAMISVGLWSVFLGRPLVHMLPVVFPAAMFAGAVIGMLGINLPSVEIGIALSVLVLGVCIAASFRAPVVAASIIVAAFAVFHGHAHGQELPAAADPIGYSAGFVLATCLLHVLGIGIGLLISRPSGVLVTRGVGGAIGVAGAWFLYRAIGL